jgi:hypothetical protein
MRSIFRNLPLLLLAAGGCTSLTAIAQNSAPSLPVNASINLHLTGGNIYGTANGIDASLTTEIDRQDKGADYPTITQLGLQYAAAVKVSTQVAAAAPIPYLMIDAPSPAAEREPGETATAAGGVLIAPRPRQLKLDNEIQRNTGCESGTLRGKPCRVSWSRVLSESFFFLAAQHGGNIAMDHDTRNALTHGSFWGDYAYCVEHYRWSRWKDDDPFGVDYIGHPMMGAVTSSIYEQNDPKQRALMYENSRRYWMGRLRAMAYSAAYSAQWKVGPASEASVGNTGLFYYVRTRDGVWTNETGMQDFFITPIGGLAWNVGEDAIDRFILSRVRHRTRNKWLLLASALSTPGKSTANVARFRAPYYRDYDLDTASALVR